MTEKKNCTREVSPRTPQSQTKAAFTLRTLRTLPRQTGASGELGWLHYRETLARNSHTINNDNLIGLASVVACSAVWYTVGRHSVLST